MTGVDLAMVDESVLGSPALERTPARRFRLRLRLGRGIGLLWLGLILLFIYAPIIVVAGASLDPGTKSGVTAFLQFPPRGITFDWYFAIKPQLWASLWFSLKLGGLVSLAALAITIPSALAVAKGSGRHAPVLEAFFRVPLQIPFIVSGVAFLQVYYALARGFGIGLPGSLTGLFLAHLFVAMPYAFGAIVMALRRVNFHLEEAAQSLGAPYWRVLLRVTLPLAAPGIFAGAVYAFLVSFTDVTISVLLSGQNAVPFPVYVLSSISNDLDATVTAISTLVFLVSLGALFLLQRLFGVEAVAIGAKNQG